MDVINAAKKISEAGSKLDKLCRQIADQVNNVQLQITIRSKCHLKVSLHNQYGLLSFSVPRFCFKEGLVGLLAKNCSLLPSIKHYQ